VAVVAFVAAGFVGCPVSTSGVLALLVILAGGAWALGGRRQREEGTCRPPAEPGWLRWGARLALGAAAGLFLWKLALAPVWSWDHFVMWGLKARRLAAAGEMDFSFLAEPQLQRSKADTPVGLPVAWLLFSLGAVPGAVTFKLAHAAFALGTLAAVRAAAARLAASSAAGDLAAAFVAVSPLLWDTTTLGLADLPLAFFAAAAVAALLASLPDAPRGASGPHLRGLAIASLLAGFLPWVKDEGLPLAVLLLLVAAVWLRPRRRTAEPEAAPPSPTSPEPVEGRGPLPTQRLSTGEPAAPRRAERRPPTVALAAFAVPLLLGVATMGLVDLVALPEGEKFLTGDWMGRAADRLVGEGRAILAAVGGELAAAEWLGLWYVFAAATVLALLPRRRAARSAAPPPVWPLAAAVAVQLALYVAVILAGYLPPLDQVRSGLFRIASALVPLAVLPVAALAHRHGAAVEWTADRTMTDHTPATGPLGFIRELASRLRYPQLFFLTAGLFVLDLAIPDLLPFADEILLGLLTVLLARVKDRRPPEGEPRVKNVTPPGR
jgi:hypothetical protein